MANYIGIDIGGMSIKAGIVNKKGEILAKDSIVPDVRAGQEAMAKDMYRLCENVAKKGGLSMDGIDGIGFGSPGTVDTKKGVITFAANLGFYKFPLLKEFAKYWKGKTAVGNDANCAAYGETIFGSGKNKTDTIFITLGTGVGTGFVIDGKILTGYKGAGTEGGHICIRMGGEKCSCGERGCWEAYASATALIAQTENAISKNPDSAMVAFAEKEGGVSGKTAFECAKQGDKVALKVVNTYCKYVATGLVLLINLFRPEVVMIGGGVSNAGDFFIDKVKAIVKKHCFGKKVNKVPEIVRAQLGNDAGIIGAAALVMD